MLISRYVKLLGGLLLLSGLCFAVQVEAANLWYVAATVGNARSEPATHAELVAQLAKGTAVTETARQGNWLKVLTPAGEEVWMHQVTLTKQTKGVELFGQDLTQTNRTQMRQALASSKVITLRELDAYPYDLYDPSPWLTGATEMVLGYTPTSQAFAVAEIAFRSEDDTEQVRLVAEQVAKELGPWNRVLGRRASGPVEFEWRKGATRVLVHRGWPDTTTYLVYEVPVNMQLMQDELNKE